MGTMQQAGAGSTLVSAVQLGTTIFVMRRYGGAFVKQLAELLAVADPQNTARVLAAFPEVFAKYGPGSKLFEAVTRGEVPA
jgi:hypothetical protein